MLPKQELCSIRADSHTWLVLTKVLLAQSFLWRQFCGINELLTHVPPLQQGQPDSPSESKRRWLDLCGDIYREEMEKTEQYSEIVQVRLKNKTTVWNVISPCLRGGKKDVSHSWQLAITSPVVCKPTQIQEERHRLCPPVEYFLAVDKFNLKYTCYIYSELLLISYTSLTMLFHWRRWVLYLEEHSKPFGSLCIGCLSLQIQTPTKKYIYFWCHQMSQCPQRD